MSTPDVVPVYFEQSWAILSTIGVINLFFGITVVGITSLSPISMVPIVVSIATAIANGMCYYAFYANYSLGATVAAGVAADFFWLIQEAGLPFYSYLILSRLLTHLSRRIFLAIFWFLIAIIVALRLCITGARARNTWKGDDELQNLVSRLHIGYFTSIAVVECVSAGFLLRKFGKARKAGRDGIGETGLFAYLMRSTEVRLTSLAVIGMTRAITYSFQETAQSATNIASQVDRFVYTMECMFPVMMFIDILSSRLVVTNHINSSNERRSYANRKRKSTGKNRTTLANQDIRMYSANHVETIIETNNRGQRKGSMTESTERIVEMERRESKNSRNDYGDLEEGRIHKTVDFEFIESNAV